MSAPKEKGADVFTEGIKKLSTWIGFIVTVAGLIGTYYVNNYKNAETAKHVEDLEVRVRTLEKINPDLIMQQLKTIESMNQQTDQKIQNTNQRVDEVLKVLINK